MLLSANSDDKRPYRAKTPRMQRKFFFLRTWRPFDSAQDMLCTFARDTVFPISFSSIFKYLWLGFDLMDMILK